MFGNCNGPFATSGYEWKNKFTVFQGTGAETSRLFLLHLISASNRMAIVIIQGRKVNEKPRTMINPAKISKTRNVQ